MCNEKLICATQMQKLRIQPLLTPYHQKLRILAKVVCEISWFVSQSAGLQSWTEYLAQRKEMQ